MIMVCKHVPLNNSCSILHYCIASYTFMIITGAVYINQLLNSIPTLQYLNMRRNDIGDEGIAIISKGLQHNRSLTTLKVVNCQLSVSGSVCSYICNKTYLFIDL